MIEERALVIDAGDGYAWVETQRQSSCGNCSVNKGCGTAALAKVMGHRRTRLRVLSNFSLQAGDEVIIGIEERALVQGSLAVYIGPLASMLVGAGFGQLAVGSETASVLLGIGGLLGGFVWLRHFGRDIRNDSRFQPVVLHRLSVIAG
jgi:sigma-E factor negative regulatory protein RseC